MSGYAYAGVKQLRKLLDAVMAVGSELSLSIVLRRITEVATELVDAKCGAVGVLDPSGTRLSEFITVGIDEADFAAIGHLPEGHGILGLLIKDAEPLRLPDLSAHPDSYGFPPNHPPMLSFSVSPSSCATRNARLHEKARDLTLADERHRMARDLHDDVIQRLFATGLTVQSMAQLIRDEATADRMIQVVEDLDETIRRLRSTILQLRRRRESPPSVRADVIAVCSEAGRALGFEPMCQILGPLDTAVNPAVAGHLVLTRREALSNVARERAGHTRRGPCQCGRGLPHTRGRGRRSRSHGNRRMRATVSPTCRDVQASSVAPSPSAPVTAAVPASSGRSLSAARGAEAPREPAVTAAEGR